MANDADIKNFIQKIRGKIAELEYHFHYYLSEKGKTTDAFDKALLVVHMKCVKENCQFLYEILKEIDKDWDGKIFFDEPQYNHFKIW